MFWKNGAELKALGSRAMIVTGKHSSRINGSLAAVEQALQANGQTYVIFDEIEENPSVETVAVGERGIAVKKQGGFLCGLLVFYGCVQGDFAWVEPIGNRSCRERLYHPGAHAGSSGCRSSAPHRLGLKATPHLL